MPKTRLYISHSQLYVASASENIADLPLANDIEFRDGVWGGDSYRGFLTPFDFKFADIFVAWPGVNHLPKFPLQPTSSVITTFVAPTRNILLLSPVGDGLYPLFGVPAGKYRLSVTSFYPTADVATLVIQFKSLL